MSPKMLSTTALAMPFALMLGAPTYAYGAELQSAQSGQPAEASAQPESEPDGEIVVTARRRNEAIQSVPLAVTAITPDELQSRGIETGADLAIATPGLQVQPGLEGRTAARFYIRGQGIGFGGAPPSVVPYFNEVPLDVNGGATFALNDVQAVQVLRGPQGTLFGRNANGGVVLLTATPPSDHVDGFVDLAYGNYDYVQASGAVSVPISNTLGVRLSGQLRRRDGYTENLSGPDRDNIRTFTGRIFVRWRPSENFTNDLVYNYFEGRSAGIGTILNAVRPGTPAAVAYPLPNLPLVVGTGLPADLIYQNGLGPRKVDDPSPYFGEDTTIHLVTNTTTLNVGNLTFKNIFGYERVSACASLPVANTRTNFFVASCFDNYLNRNFGVEVVPTNDLTQITEEFNVSGDFMDGRLQAIAGAFFLWSNPVEELGQFTATRTSKSLFIANVTSALSEDRSQAVYAQATYELVDGLRLTAGVRHTWDQRAQQFGQFTSRANGVPGTFDCVTPGQPANAPLNQCLNIFRENFSDWGYTFGLDWRVNPDFMLYVQTRRGYKSGGFNSTSASLDPSYGPEILRDAEVGLKYTFRNSWLRGRLNVAYFHMWYEGIQQQLSIIDQITGGATVVTTNAGGAQLDGVELEFDLTFFNRLRLSGFYTFLDSAYDRCPVGVPVAQLTPADCFIDSGRDVSSSLLLNTPRNTFSVTASYTAPLGNTGDLVGQLSYYTRSRQAFAADNIINFEGIAPGYQVVNARLTLDNINQSGLSVSAFVDNLFDNDYIVSGIGLGGLIGTNSVIYGEPRTYGINLRYQF